MGMNPGPWGMAQTGVPFGDVTMVRNWLRIEGPLRPPLPDQHPKYPISGFACARREGSGKRLWEWAAARFGGPEKFFESYFVINYCPLLFIAHEKNLTPERLSRGESERLTTHCNHYLEQVLAVLNPSLVVGVGRYAERQLRIVAGSATGVTYLPHPSPANPAANRGWADIADRILQVES